MDDRLFRWKHWWKVRGAFGMRFQTLKEAENYLALLDGEISGTAHPVNDSTTTVTGTLGGSPDSPEPEESPSLESFWSEDGSPS